MKRTWRRNLLVAGGAALAAAGVAAFTRPQRFFAGPVSEFSYGPNRGGALFSPPSIPDATPCPLILLYDPGGAARAIVERYAKAAAERGWLAASSFAVANGTSDESDTEHMMAIVDYVRARHALDDSRIFAGGFSGGACGAYRLAIVKSEIVRGAIVECGHMGSWRAVGAMASSALRFYLFTRDQDFNRPATRQLLDAMRAKGCRATEVEATGGHAPMNEVEISAAMAWMSA